MREGLDEVDNLVLDCRVYLYACVYLHCLQARVDVGHVVLHVCESVGWRKGSEVSGELTNPLVRVGEVSS